MGSLQEVTNGLLISNSLRPPLPQIWLTPLQSKLASQIAAKRNVDSKAEWGQINLAHVGLEQAQSRTQKAHV